jgi:hypothetical protein
MARFLVIGLIIFGLSGLGFTADIGVTKIFAPTGIIPPDNYIPRAQIKNYGGGEESLWVYFRILPWTVFRSILTLIM